MRVGPAIAAVGLAFACGDFVHAAGVFLPAGEQVPAGERESRFVRIAHDELRRVRAEVGDFGRSRLLFNVGGRTEFDVTVDRTARTLDGYTLSGQIDGGKGGFVTLAVHGQAVAGSIWTWGTSYVVAHVGGGLHAVRKAADEPFECGGVAQAPSVEPRAPAPASSVGDDAAVVDILVFWTPALEAARGGESAVKLWIEFAIAYANDALERSGALVSLNLVGYERADLEETSPFDLVRDDVLARVGATDRADALGADFISVFTVGGTTSVAGALEDGTLVSAFNSHSRVWGVPWPFAHEVGHNLGLSHDRGAWGLPSRSYNGGYVSIDTDSHLTRCEATIMSYGTLCVSAGSHVHRIPYYSTPNRYRPGTGTQLGMSRLSSIRGWDGPADAVLAINRNRYRKSDIRPRRSAP